MKAENKEKVKAFFKGLFREGLQTLPVVGTFVTNFKQGDDNNIKLTAWDGYRLAIGLVIGVVLAKGIMTPDQIEFVMSIIGWD